VHIFITSFSAVILTMHGVCSPLYTPILPLRIDPYTDGRAWARREGHDRHRGVRQGEELKDEESEQE